MARHGVWWWACWGSLLVLVLGGWRAARGAHIPPVNNDALAALALTDTADAPDDTDSSGGTENNRLELLQELLELKRRAEDLTNEITSEEGGKSAPRTVPQTRVEEARKVVVKVKRKPTTTTTTTTTTTEAPTPAPEDTNDVEMPSEAGGGGGGGPPPPPAAGQGAAAGGSVDRGLFEFTKQQLNSLFLGGLRGNASVVAGCQIPDLNVQARCFANVMEVSLISRMALVGGLTMEGGDGWADMRGAYQVVYAVVGGAGRRGRLTTRLLKPDVDVACDYCHYLTVLLYLKVDKVKCLLVGECAAAPTAPPRPPQTPTPAIYVPPTTTTTTTTTPPPPPPSRAHDPTMTAKTTMQLLEDSTGLDGVDVSGPVSLGTKLSLVISAFSVGLPLDLHLVKCEARDEEGRAVVLLKDGCSVSQVLEDFREVVEAAGEPQLRRVSQYARLRVFNTRAAPQNITLLCTVKVCSGECPERPACVNSDINLGRSKRPIASLHARQVTLAKAFRVAGFPINRPNAAAAVPASQPQKPSAAGNTNNHQQQQQQPSKDCDCSHITQQQVDALARPRDCLSYRTLYLLIGLFAGLLLLFVLSAYYFLRRPSLFTLSKGHMEDTESPSRALYTEYSSPRRRTPQSSPEYSTLTMSKDARHSPMYPP